ncbi:30S ribosomal protein S16 [Candidatus Woesebacteria bacterium RBG_19FT_COMBO_42_9]|uniref:Small ribosomal subunit protein bS16 n=1 Tax=Candidatus Woesebacteria bacterium RBG_16_42_24 TaxID=1802485 RepID=A0A1F7XK58_9BACT|nr:MAG: 30S ribosomal protein S16 [Candidatus Woesebacteria bacterium RBG_16_42_24]OGM16358.1 MAG: 30S ribosomal protein S16 [Candidatus Woesebacteria bacterium RBG_19FT_COMBO_42_9]OGM67407.1 MAG: 30S ribosomal protein S16 [Candidatus Woesebacteria bacterium RIFCSPLOWO2_01_FULL_43_11]
MLVIKLHRVGVRRKTFYRIVVVDKKVKKGGKNLDILGFWQPSKDYKKIDTTKVKSWQAQGAKLSKGVTALISQLHK